MSYTELKSIRKYTVKGIDVLVEIDSTKGTVSLVELHEGTYRHKPWYFAGRSLGYMQGWKNILFAMMDAIDEATKVLEELKEKQAEELADMLAASKEVIR